MLSQKVSKGLATARDLLRRTGGAKAAAAGAGVFLALAVAVGAGAAPSPIAPFSEVLGLGGEHGAAVSEAVHEAKEAALAGDEEGEEDDETLALKIGAAVSEAACMAAHDRSTLPPGAQNAPGQNKDEERPEKDCTHPSNQESEEEEEASEEEIEPSVEELEDLTEEEFENHGAAVSNAVHEAKESLEEGEKVGPAVSEAACMAAHDRSTLPQGAQDAPGQNNEEERPEKDCTHPSNAGEDGEGEEELSESESSSGPNGRGRESAPGQQKKQQD